METNSKKLSVRLVSGKAISIILSGFQYATSLFFNFGIKIPMTFIGKSREKLITTISIKKITIRALAKIRFSISQTIKVSKITANIIARERKKIISPIKLRVRISPISKAIQRVSSSIFLRRIRIVASPTIATFYTLATFDPQALSVNDSKTLLQMDYTT